MSIIARNLKREDVEKIDDIFQRNPIIGVPGLKNMVVNAVMEDTEKDQIIAYGAVKIFAEAILIMDKEVTKREKAEALMEAMKTAILFARDAGVEILYANSNDENFTRCLERRFKFKRVPGQLLCLDLNPNFEDKDEK